MPDRDAFIQHICESPDDDGPRLVFADWLEEQGESDRAELIRVQCELARLEADGSDSQFVYEFVRSTSTGALDDIDWDRLDPGVARRHALRSRSDELVAKHEKAWKAAEAPKRCGVKFHTTWHRGFMSAGVVANPKLLARSADAVFRRAPLEWLIFGPNSGEHAQALADAGVLRRTRSLSTRLEAAAVIETFGGSPDARHVRGLEYSIGPETDRFARAVAGSSHWSGLEALDLGIAWLSADAAEDLFAAAHLRDLVRLRIRGTDLPRRTVQALADAGFARLRDLDLTCAHPGDLPVDLLAAAADLGQLRRLSLDVGDVTGAAATALLASPHLTNLVVLRLYVHALQGFDAAALSAAPGRSLQVLVLSGARLTAADVAALADCPAVRGVVWLSLAEGLDDGAAAALARAPAFPRLRVLELNYNRLGDREIQALADWPGLASVRHLHLYANPIGPNGAKALAASPYLDGVRSLTVSRKPIGLAGVRALRRRLGDAVKWW